MHDSAIFDVWQPDGLGRRALPGQLLTRVDGARSRTGCGDVGALLHFSGDCSMLRPSPHSLPVSLLSASILLLLAL